MLVTDAARGQRQSAGKFTPCCLLSALIQSRQLLVPDMFPGRAGGSSTGRVHRAPLVLNEVPAPSQPFPPVVPGPFPASISSAVHD